ncbi:hypothetical protein HALLA_00695 (plasmid) [Halostagnicola larsenii XH-48]|uniref:Tyr recombinase domain-containing protein n=1 Tax=Halostagnicola larsenii XH-48 TaxID=797299 RepID=W0JX34_9EURY|nr:hypothetical protein HALLA_00695 [Halostagnicola larsenii XH-48]
MDLAHEGTIDVSRKIAYHDRAIVVLLADAGVRGAELFRDPRDDARNGVTWGDVDLENRSLEVFGKSRQYERVGLSSAAREALESSVSTSTPSKSSSSMSAFSINDL